MYIILIFILSCLLGWVIWRRLCLTGIPAFLRVILALLAVALIFVALFWISVYVSIYLFQWKDPIS